VKGFFAMNNKRALPIVITGDVDHGKSTLIGRLLHDTGALPEGKVEALKEASRKRGMPFEWSFVMDALKVERDQGITIDTTRIRFSSGVRDYVIIDAPGHAEFLKNMLTGAAAAEAALLVVDVVEGMSEQARRHAFLLKLLGITEIVVAVNKMDRCGWAKQPFDRAASSVAAYLAGLDLAAAAIIPISARNGDMIAHRSVPPSWYDGATVLQALDALKGADSEAQRPLRLPVQDVYKFDERRIVVGRIDSGRLRVGDRLRFSPGERSARIASIESWSAQPAVTAAAGQSVGLTFEEDIFVERGQVASAPEAAPLSAQRLKLRLFHFGQAPLVEGEAVKLQIGLAEQAATIAAIESVIDINDLVWRRAAAVARHDIADVVLHCRMPIAVETAAQGRHLGRGILRRGYQIVGGFLIEAVLDAPQIAPAPSPARHVTAVTSAVSARERGAAWGHSGGVLWLTGLSGAGKSTLALALERELFRRNWRAVLLDGDSLRGGLNADLGFGEAERAENVRRIGAVAQHLAASGMIAIVACIAPRRSQRARLREALGALYHEIYVKASLEACERRDVKGLYAKARRGEIQSFTGVSDVYEAPAAPQLEIDTDALSPAEGIERLLGYVDRALRPADLRRLAS
jgi:bifunctional enzyme CysN/CysC